MNNPKRILTPAVDRDWLFMPGSKIPVSEIIAAVARYNGIHPSDLTGPRRYQRLSRVRHIAMWLAHELRPDLSLPQLGRAFARDHTTILYALKCAPERFGKRDPAAVWFEVSGWRQSSLADVG